MTRTVRYFWITGTAAAALLVPTRAAAMPDSPAPEPDRLRPVVQIVEVPIDDTENEATQVVIAAAMGAAVTAAAGRRRAARRFAHPNSGPIDITDVVQSGPDAPSSGEPQWNPHTAGEPTSTRR